MRPKARILFVFLAVLLVSAGCDHASKTVAVSALAETGGVSLAGDVLRLELASNSGAFMSLGAGLPEGVRDFLFLGLVPLLVLVLCGHLLRASPPSVLLAVGLGLVAGGGMANWLDRLLHDGAVTDFLTLGVGPLRTGVFNIADVAIVCGVVMLLVCTRRSDEPARGQAT